MPIYQHLCQHVLMPLGDLLSGQRVTRYLRFYQTSQWWPWERLRTEQDRLLRETIALTYREVPFYRELWDRCGVRVDDIRGVADLPRLPLTDKSMLRAAFPALCTRRTPFSHKDYSTGGSTGQPFVVRVDADSMSRARALMLLRTTYAGWAPGDPILQTGMAVKRGAVRWLKDKALRVAYRSAYDLSDAVLDQYLDTIERRRVSFISGYAQSLFLLARRARRVGFTLKLRGAIAWGSNLLEQYRAEIMAAFGCPTIDSYGVGEGMQIAAQCGSPEGFYHQFCLHVAVELVAGGEPVEEGQQGEYVLTRLDAGTMPLIRYRVGDIGRAAPNDRCSCGRGLPMLRSIDGRTSDLVLTPNGNRLIVEFFNGLFQYAPTIDAFQIVQTEAGAIHVKIVPLPGFVIGDWEAVRNAILEKGDRDLKITMETVSEIPLEPSQKRRYIKSTLGFGSR